MTDCKLQGECKYHRSLCSSSHIRPFKIWPQFMTSKWPMKTSESFRKKLFSAFKKGSGIRSVFSWTCLLFIFNYLQINQFWKLILLELNTFTAVSVNRYLQMSDLPDSVYHIDWSYLQISTQILRLSRRWTDLRDKYRFSKMYRGSHIRVSTEIGWLWIKLIKGLYGP